MAMINSYKQAFVFSLLSIFIAFLIFGFGFLYISKAEITNEKVFKESRILYINDEVKYYRDIYLPSTMSFAFHSTLNALVENRTLLQQINKNYSKLNSLIFEGVTNGSFNGVAQSKLENKTFNYLYDVYKSNFDKNFNGNFTYKLKGINVYEKKPFYVNFLYSGNFKIMANVQGEENVSWEFEQVKEVAVPVYNMVNPEFNLFLNQKYPILSSEVEISQNNWTLELFNESLQNIYSTVSVHDKYKYTLGSSFLRSVLGDINGSYLDVFAFFSFDYDEKEGQIYDSSLNPTFNSTLYGTTYLFYSFDDETIVGTQVLDVSDYNISGNLSGPIVCNIFGISNEVCQFDGVSNVVNISNSEFNLNFTNKVSISAWIYPKIYDHGNGYATHIFRYGNNAENVISLRLDQNRKILMEVGNHSVGNYSKYISNSNISLNEWTFVTATFNGELGVGKIYINGVIDNLNENGTINIINKIPKFVKSPNLVTIGGFDTPGPWNTNFEGFIDEFQVFSKELTQDEILTLYDEKKGKLVEYKQTRLGKGIEFDGKSNYVKIDNSGIALVDEFTVEAWIKLREYPNATITDRAMIIRDPYLTINNSGNVCVFNYGVNDVNGDYYYCSDLKLDLNKWYYLTTTFSNINGEFKIYINSKLDKIIGGKFGNPRINLGYIGGEPQTNNGRYFNGLIDEIKVYSRALDDIEIEQHYFNYAGSSKGCCNYISLINPNEMRFNTSPYNASNISYSSSIFIKYFNNLNNDPNITNITLFNIPNITSNNNLKNYTNLRLDICMMANTFNVFNYYETSSNVNDFLNLSGYDKANCEILIRDGFY